MLEVAGGETLLGMIAAAKDRCSAILISFVVVDVLQICCLRKRDGAIWIVKGEQIGIIFHTEVIGNLGQWTTFAGSLERMRL